MICFITQSSVFTHNGVPSMLAPVLVVEDGSKDLKSSSVEPDFAEKGYVNQ